MVKLRPSKWSASGSTGSDSFKPYAVLVQKSKAVGKLATRIFFDARDFLRKDVSLPPAASQLLTKFQFKPVGKAVKNEELKVIESLKSRVKKSHQILAKGHSVFPFKLFPDDIILDRTKITIIKRDFFWIATTISVRIEDVLNVTVSTGPFFGSVNVAIRVMNSTDHYTISYLWRREAVYLKRIIQGYMIAQHNKIDTSQLSKQELIDTLCELGTDSNI